MRRRKIKKLKRYIIPALFCLSSSSDPFGGIIPPFEATVSLMFKDRSFKSSSPFFLRQIEYYQKFVDPAMKKKLGVKRICPYSPTCSEYAKLVIKRYGPFMGMLLGAAHLLRCSPLFWRKP